MCRIARQFTAIGAGFADERGFGFAIAKALAEAGATVSVATWRPLLKLCRSYLAAQRVVPGYGGGMSSAKSALRRDGVRAPDDRVTSSAPVGRRGFVARPAARC